MFYIGGNSMKMKKLFSALTLSSLLVAGTLVAFSSARAQKNTRVKASTDIGEVAISEVRNAISSASVTYLLPTQNYSLPDSWDYAYAGVGDDDGVFINGEKQVGAVLIYAGTGSAFTTFYYGLPSAAVEGDVVEFKGTFATESDGGWSFSIHYVTQRFANQWVHKLEAYDTVSLADANMPDFENVAVNTEDDASYAYTTDAAALPSRKGYFGLTNDTGSYAFQFLFTKTVQSAGLVEVRIGGTGSWGTGHFIKYMFSNEWNSRGYAFVKEYQGNGDIWSPTELQTSPEFIPELTGNENLIEFGAIKVAGSSQYLMFFKNNNAVLWSAYWTLDSAARTTRVGIFYNQADAKFNNTVDLVATEKLHTPAGGLPDLYTNSDICPAVHNWSDYFMSVDGNGLKLNGVPFGSNQWNYFKKTDACNYYFDLAAASGSATISSGDILYIGGVFKAARTVDTGVLTLFKVVFADSYFTYNGTTWVELYQATDFAKDLLKMTMSICTGGDANNHDALVSVWSTLAGANYWGSLSALDQSDLKDVPADPTIVVPATTAGIDAMDDEDAQCAAMYRYDYCTAKYNLNNFITGRTLSVSFARINFFNNEANDIGTMTIVIIVAAIVLITAAGLFFVSKRKQDR